MEELQASFSLGCPTGVDGDLSVAVVPDSEPALVEPFSFSAAASSPARIVSPELADRMCGRLRELPGNEGDIPGSKQARVRLRLDYVGQCRGESTVRRSAYLVTFTLLCTDVSKIHAPSGADPGPAGDGFASETVEAEAVAANSPGGAGVAYERSLDASGRHVLRFAAGIREESVTVPASRFDGFGLLSADRLGQSFSELTRVDTELEIVPVDISYGYRLRPPGRRIVPTVYVGAGYAFADSEVATVQGGDSSEFLGPALGALGSSDESSFTLHAGLSVRFHLDRYGRGKYLYAGVRSRWYEQRELDETDEEVFVGLGLPVCTGGRR